MAHFIFFCCGGAFMVGCVGNISRVWEELKWGIYLVFGKNLKREMEGIENSDPNQNNPFITAAMGIGGAAISIFFPNTKPIVDGVKPLAEKGLQEAFRKKTTHKGAKNFNL